METEDFDVFERRCGEGGERVAEKAASQLWRTLQILRRPDYKEQSSCALKRGRESVYGVKSN